jgi:hypothetical protein
MPVIVSSRDPAGQGAHVPVDAWPARRERLLQLQRAHSGDLVGAAECCLALEAEGRCAVIDIRLPA